MSSVSLNVSFERNSNRTKSLFLNLILVWRVGAGNEGTPGRAVGV